MINISQENSMILIIDHFGEKIHQLIAHLKNKSIPLIVYPYTLPVPEEVVKLTTGIVLTGGPGTPTGPLNLNNEFCLIRTAPKSIPILGLCLGIEIIAHVYGSTIGKCPSGIQNKIEQVEIKQCDPIFYGLKNPIDLKEEHAYIVTELSPLLINLASSSASPVEVLRHPYRHIYGFQSHPEVSGEAGLMIIDNWLRFCGYN